VSQLTDDAVNFVCMLLKQRGAALRFFVRFHGAVLALFGTKRDRVNSCFCQHRQNLFATALCQMVREKPAVPDDHSHCHFLFLSHDPTRRLACCPWAQAHPEPKMMQMSVTGCSIYANGSDFAAAGPECAAINYAQNDQ